VIFFKKKFEKEKQKKMKPGTPLGAAPVLGAGF